MSKHSISLCFLVAALGFATSTPAAANLLIDGSFEDTGTAAGSETPVEVGSAAIPGWTVVTNGGSAVDNGTNVTVEGNGAFGLYTPFGTDFLDLTGKLDRVPYDGVTQAVSTVIDQAYALSFSLGAKASGSFGGPISATASAGPSSTTPVTSMTFNDPVTTGTTINGMIWTAETLTFTATSTTTAVTIVGTASNSGFIGLDNADLELAGTPVSEPGTLMMLSATVLAVAASRRCRR